MTTTTDYRFSADEYLADNFPKLLAIGRRCAMRQAAKQGVDCSADTADETAQDCLARIVVKVRKLTPRPESADDADRTIVRMLLREISNAKRWNRAPYGHDNAYAWRDDAMVRRVPGETMDARELTDSDRLTPIDNLDHVYADRDEITALLSELLPQRLQATAIFRAMGIGRDESATLQGVSVSTVRNQLAEVRRELAPLHRLQFGRRI